MMVPKTAAAPNGLRLVKALRGLADTADVPVDGSCLPCEENVALVR